MSNYSPRDIIISFADKDVQGVAKGTFVKVTKNAEQYKLDIGSKGDATQVESLDNSGKIVVTLQRTSPSNDDFSAWLRNAKLRRGPRSSVVQITDLNGASLHHDDKAFLEKMGDDERGDDASTVDWTIVCPNLDSFVGGAAS